MIRRSCRLLLADSTQYHLPLHGVNFLTCCLHLPSSSLLPLTVRFQCANLIPMLLLSMLNLACQGSVSKAASAYGLNRWPVYYGNNMTVKLPWESLQQWHKICITDMHQPSTSRRKL